MTYVRHQGGDLSSKTHFLPLPHLCFISFLGFVFLLLPGLHYGTYSIFSCMGLRNSLFVPDRPMSPLVHPMVGWSSESIFLYHNPPLPSVLSGEWSKSQTLVTFTESINMRLDHLKGLICLFGEYVPSPLLSHWYFKEPQPLREQKQSPMDLSKRKMIGFSGIPAPWRAGFPDSKQKISLGLCIEGKEVRREQRALSGKTTRSLCP